jgi:hypothetical protein
MKEETVHHMVDRKQRARKGLRTTSVFKGMSPVTCLPQPDPHLQRFPELPKIALPAGTK